MPRINRLQNFFHFHAPRAFQKQQVARSDEIGQIFCGCAGIIEESRAVLCMAGFESGRDDIGGVPPNPAMFAAEAVPPKASPSASAANPIDARMLSPFLSKQGILPPR